MKPPDPAILERNLALLLRRAYVPALARPSFRRRLARSWGEEAARRFHAGHSEPRRPTRRGRLLRWSPALVAAALAALVGLRWRAAAPGAPDLGALLVEAAAAVRTPLEDGAWRAATADEAARGVALADGGLEAATAADGVLRVRVADGEVRLAPGTRARFDAAEPLAARLEAGALAAERPEAGPAWRLATRDGALHLRQGRVELAREGELDVVALAEGEAWYQAGDARTDLEPGVGLRFRGGTPLADENTAAGARPEGPGDARRTLETPPVEPAATAAASPPARSISGSVRDAESGQPVRAFRVALLPERVGNEPRLARTRDFEEADGAFTWDGIEPFAYDVFVHAPGHALLRLGRWSVTDERPVRLPTALLVRGGSVRGYVVDPLTGNPVPGALVLSEDDAPIHGIGFWHDDRGQWLPASTTTAADGGFELTHLNPGQHRLRASLRGYAPAWSEPLEVRAGEPLEGVTLSLGNGGSLTGVVERPDGSPLAGAPLIVTPMENGTHPVMSYGQTLTDDEGHYSVANLPPGMFLAILVTDPQAPPKVRPVSIVAGAESVLDFRGERRGTRLFGKLLGPDGEAIGNKNLGLFSSDAQSSNSDWKASTSLADGSYVIDGLAPGTYELLVVDDRGGSVTAVDRIEVPDWPELEHDVRLSRLRIEGRSLDAVDDGPLQRSIVILESLGPDGTVFGGMTPTDERGVFAFEGIPAGRYQLTAYATSGGLGFATAEPFDLDANTRRVARDLRHGPGGSVEVTVLDEEGAPVAQAEVTFLDERGREYSFSQFPLTDAAGHHRARGLRPGAYRVAVQAADQRAGSARFECTSGRVASVRVILEMETR